MFEHPELIDHLEKVDWPNVEFEKFDPETVFTKYLVDQVGLDQETVQKVKDKITGKGLDCEWCNLAGSVIVRWADP